MYILYAMKDHTGITVTLFVFFHIWNMEKRQVILLTIIEKTVFIEHLQFSSIPKRHINSREKLNVVMPFTI